MSRSSQTSEVSGLGEQLSLGSDFLPELDRKKTQEAVEEALEKYRFFKYLTSEEEREASITAGYSDMPRGSGISDQTSSIAIHNVDSKMNRRVYCEKIERAVRPLPRMEKFLITERYMTEESEYITDLNIYNFKFQPPVNKDTYSKIRWKAFYKLVFKLDELKILNLNDLVKPG